MATILENIMQINSSDIKKANEIMTAADGIGRDAMTGEIVVRGHGYSRTVKRYLNGESINAAWKKALANQKKV